MAERRRHSRSPVHANAYAAIGRGFTKVGRIRDISEGGLAFDYIVGEGAPGSARWVDLFTAESALHLRGIPCRIVYEIDIEVPRVAKPVAAMLTKRRCGIRFEETPEDHRQSIRLFIQYCASNCAAEDVAFAGGSPEAAPDGSEKRDPQAAPARSNR